MQKQNIFQKLGFYVKDFFAHWNTPPKEGYYLPNKEFAAYAVGGMGVLGFGILYQYFTINIGIHLSVHYNFDQDIVYWTGNIVAILSVLRGPIVGYILDNSNTKYGKYRPFLLYAGVASVVAFWLLAFIPDLFMPDSGVYENNVQKWLVIGTYQLLYFLAFTAWSFFSFGRLGLAQVITPNTNERTKLYSIGGIIDSFGPSVVQLFFPLIAQAVYGQYGIAYKDFGGKSLAELKELGLVKPNFAFGMENIMTYKVLFPIFGLICVAIALLMFFGTKERIVEEKNVKQKVKFFEGVKKCFKNKYFLINSFSEVLAFGRLLIFGSTTYICAHMFASNPALGESMRGIIPTVCATLCLPGMALSPILNKKLGKKKITIISFAGSACTATVMMLLCAFMYSSPATPWLLFVCIAINNLFGALWVVASPAMMADLCEYQQWKTGDRLDGFMGQLKGVLQIVFGMLTGYASTQVMIAVGAGEASSFYNPEIMRKVFIVWGAMGLLCGVLAIIPYLFWDLTEAKQLQMTKEIKIRGLKEKFADNTLVQEDIPDAVALGIISAAQAVELGFSVSLDETAEISEDVAADDLSVEPTAEIGASNEELAEDVPAVDTEDAPAVDTEDAPAVDAEDAPAVDAEDAPAVDTEETPTDKE